MHEDCVCAQNTPSACHLDSVFQVGSCVTRKKSRRKMQTAAKQNANSNRKTHISHRTPPPQMLNEMFAHFTQHATTFTTHAYAHHHRHPAKWTHDWWKWEMWKEYKELGMQLHPLSNQINHLYVAMLCHCFLLLKLQTCTHWGLAGFRTISSRLKCRAECSSFLPFYFINTAV